MCESHTYIERLPLPKALLGEQDAREMYRRELAEGEIDLIPVGEERASAVREEEARVEAYELSKQAQLQLDRQDDWEDDESTVRNFTRAGV